MLLIFLCAASAASGPTIGTNDGNMQVKLTPGKTFSISCPSDGDSAFAEGVEQGTAETQAACDAAIAVKDAEVSAANVALDTASATVEAQESAGKDKDAAIETKDAKLTEQKEALTDIKFALSACEANAANCADTKPSWAWISATKGASAQAELYVVGPDGGSMLYISGVGFDALERSHGGWNPYNIACTFTPSDEDATVTVTPTSMVDGVVQGSRLLACTTPAIADGTTANVTFHWSGGDPVSLYSSYSGKNTLYSASWYTGIELVDGL